jgi:hypothetical protein
MQLNYWRSKDKAEVDFVLRFANLEIPIEVKYTNLTKPESSRSYTSFINHYAPKYGFIINKTFSSTLKISESKIGFINYAQIYKSLNKIFENFPG